MTKKLTVFLNAIFRLAYSITILPLIQGVVERKLKYYSLCKSIPILKLREVIEENDPRLLIKNQRFVNKHQKLNYSKFDSVFFELIQEYETIRGDNNSVLMVGKLNRIAIDRYKLEVCKRLLYLHDYSEKFAKALKDFGFSGTKEQIKRKLLVLETNTELRESRLKQSITDNTGSKSTFMDEVLMVRRLLDNMNFDLTKMSAKDWAETYNSAKSIAAQNKQKQDGR